MTRLPWYRRVQLQFEFIIHLTPGDLPVHSWLFSGEIAYQKSYGNNYCFWPRAWVRIIGILLGIGIFIQGPLIHPKQDKVHA